MNSQFTTNSSKHSDKSQLISRDPNPIMEKSNKNKFINLLKQYLTEKKSTTFYD